MVSDCAGLRGSLAAVAALLMVLASAPAGAEDAMVTIDNFTFSPPSLTVKPGTKVVFVNHDDIPHTVVATGGAFRSGALDTDDKFETTLNAAATIDYFCSLHPHMKGRIVVAP